MSRHQGTPDNPTLYAALLGYQIQASLLEQKIAELRKTLGPAASEDALASVSQGSGLSLPSTSPSGRARLSPAARKRIAAAQKKRWAEHRARKAAAGGE
jgi:hypothetical protein